MSGSARSAVTLLIAAVGIAAGTPAQAAPLRLDPGFGDGGVARVPFKLPSEPTAESFAGALVTRQPGGKLLVAGALTEPELQPVPVLLARLTRDGRVDHSFGRDGRVRLYFAGKPAPSGPRVPFTDFTPVQVAVQRDRKILVGGLVTTPCPHFVCYQAPRRLALVRLLPDGQVDRSFGDNGFVARTPVKLSADIRRPTAQFGTLIVQRSGDVLVAGSSTEFLGAPTFGQASHLVLTRFRPDGSLDEGFGDGGEVRIPVDLTYAAWARSPHGKLVAMGARNQPGDALVDVVRIGRDGSVDPSFGTGGVVSLPVPYSWMYLRTLAVWPSGETLIGGGPDSFLPQPAVDLRRLDANGQVDAGFQQACRDPSPAGLGLLAATPFHDGVLVTAARRPKGSGPYDVVSRVLHFTANGCLDRRFPRLRFASNLTTPVAGGRARVLIPGFARRALVLLRLAPSAPG